MTSKSVKASRRITRRLRQEIFDVDLVRIRGLTSEPRLHVNKMILTIPAAATTADFVSAYEFVMQLVDDDIVVRFVDSGEVNMRTSWGQYLLAKLYAEEGYDMLHVIEEAEANGLQDDDRVSMDRVVHNLTRNRAEGGCEDTTTSSKVQHAQAG